MDRDTIIDKLNQLVILKTHGFCYGCYISAKVTDEGERCPKCGSDDLMRCLDGYGVEYGTESFYSPILEEIGADKVEFDDEDEERYEETLNEIYGEVSICGYTYGSGYVLRQLDPITFRCGMVDDVSSLESDEQIVEIGNKYYWTDQLDDLITEAISDAELMNS